MDVRWTVMTSKSLTRSRLIKFISVPVLVLLLLGRLTYFIFITINLFTSRNGSSIVYKSTILYLSHFLNTVLKYIHYMASTWRTNGRPRRSVEFLKEEQDWFSTNGSRPAKDLNQDFNEDYREL